MVCDPHDKLHYSSLPILLNKQLNISTSKIMDTYLTTICTSSPPTIEQVWSSGCYFFGGESRLKMQISSFPSMPLNGTTKRKTETASSTELFLLCGIILSLVVLNLVIILQDFYSGFHCIVSIFKSFLRILSCIWNALVATASPIGNCYTGRSILAETKLPRDEVKTRVNKADDNDQNHSLLRVKRVIEGTLCNSESCKIQENLSADKIVGLFEEEEPCLKEVKEAFDVFDENMDGFIDAKELGNVLTSLGFLEASEEECRRMIKAFDDDLNGLIDLSEFTKVLEKSFC